MDCRRAIHQRYWVFVIDGSVWSDFVIFSTPILHFLPRGVKADEPMGVQTFRPAVAVKAFDKAVIGRLTWPRKVQGHVIRIGP